MWERGLSRTRAEARAMFRAKARTWSSGASLYGCTIRIVRGKAVTARLLIGSDVPIIGRNERVEGLEIVSVHALIGRRPRQEMYGRRSIVSVGFLGWQRCGLRWLLGKVASSGGGLTTNTRLPSCDGSSVRLRLFFAGTMYWGSALTKPVQTKPSTHSDCPATCEKYCS